MKPTFYKIECITNLHVGSGDVNYNIVDNEVEKDITGMPMIHASGIKGALRDAMKNELGEEKTNEVFGKAGDEKTTGEGTHKFFDAHLLARPMRVAESRKMASIPVVTVASVNQFVDLLSAFGKVKYNNGDKTVEIAKIAEIDFGDNEFLTNVGESVRVEGEKTGKLEGNFDWLKGLIGENFAIAKSYDNYDLPVVARNYLENGISKNLWYEEVVPHGSIFYFAVMGDNTYTVPELVQFGGHSSIGCGYTKITKI